MKSNFKKYKGGSYKQACIASHHTLEKCSSIPLCIPSVPNLQMLRIRRLHGFRRIVPT